jgi:folate-dependent phosphoribosylglycinamide formyltransferase PurN
VALFRSGVAAVLESSAVGNGNVRVAGQQSKQPPVQRIALGKILFLGNSYNPLSIACLQAVVDAGYETIVASFDPLGQGTLKLLRKNLKTRGLSPVLTKTARLIRAKAHVAARRVGITPNDFASLPEFIHARGLKVIHCTDPNSREFVEEVRRLGVDLIVVAAFSRILKNALIHAARIACINVHPSLLPKYRGPEPYYWVLANQEKTTGVTVHHMSEQLDSGDIILQRELEIRPNENETSLTNHCSEIAARILCEAIENLLTGSAPRIPQNSAQGSYYSFPPKGVSVRKARSRTRLTPSIAPRNNSSAVYAIDPLRDPRWSAFIERHPNTSVFHSVPWLQALKRTYGFEPIVYTTSQPGSDLQNGIVFCRVNSWITGRRLVSLPFSDHCEPLVDSRRELESILGHLQTERRAGDWKYVEIRPEICRLNETVSAGGFQPS